MTNQTGLLGLIPARPLVRGPFALYGIVSAVHVFSLAAFPGTAFAHWSKAVLMPLLALGVWMAMRTWGRGAGGSATGGTASFLVPAPENEAIAPSRAIPWTVPAWLLLGAILFSWIGDTVGHFLPFVPLLPGMIGAFAIAHVLYIVLFWRYLSVRRWPWWALGYAAWYAVVVPTVGPHAGALFVPVACYAVILAGTAAAAARCRPMIAWGGLLFLLSDTALSLGLFMPDRFPEQWTGVVCMALYTAGQGLLAAGSVRALAIRPAEFHATPSE